MQLNMWEAPTAADTTKKQNMGETLQSHKHHPSKFQHISFRCSLGLEETGIIENVFSVHTEVAAACLCVLMYEWDAAWMSGVRDEHSGTEDI